MRKLFINPKFCVSSGLSTKDEETPRSTIVINVPHIFSGGQAKIYEVIKIDDKPIPGLLFKCFKPSDELKKVIDNIHDIMEVVRERNIKYEIYDCTALKTLPLTLFEVKCNNSSSYGYLMYKIEGESFNEIIMNNRNGYMNLPLEDRLQFCLQFAEGMDILYKLTIIHADINSMNLIIDVKRKKLAVLDLDGGAVAGREKIPVVIGKKEPGWLAPEIIKQLLKNINPIVVDIQTDLWSVACAIHYLLFGLQPYFFIAESPDIKIYLKKYKWPKLRNIHGISIHNEGTFDYYERAYAKVPELDRFFKVSFNEGYLDQSRRIDAYQWMLEIGDLIAKPPPPISPKLEISRTIFKFHDVKIHSSLSGTFTISNTGSGTLKGHITANKNWLKVPLNNFNTTQPRQDIIFTIDTKSLLNGFKDIGIIEIQSNGGNESISVDLLVESKEPKLEISKTSFDFSNLKKPSRVSGSFIISNAGSGTISGHITTNKKKWLIVSPMNFNITQQRQDITLSIDTSSLPYRFKDTGIIEIQSNGGTESVSVDLSVELGPKLQISKTSFDFQNVEINTTVSGSFTISNAGSGTLSGQITTDNKKWLKVSQTNINTSRPEQDITFSINTSGLKYGFKDSCIIKIKSNGGTKRVSVNLLAESTPKLEINRTSFDFQNIEINATVSDSLTISNVGGGTLNGKIWTDKEWLKVHQSRINTRSNQNIKFTLDTSNLDFDFRDTGKINIQSNGDTESVSVNLTVESPPQDTFYCENCYRKMGKKYSKHNITIRRNKLIVHCECNKVKEAKDANFRFNNFDSYAPCDCKSVDNETYHIVYTTISNHPAIFCTNCEKKIIGKSKHGDIKGWKTFLCIHCNKSHSLLNYIDLEYDNHFLCPMCGEEFVF